MSRMIHVHPEYLEQLKDSHRRLLAENAAQTAIIYDATVLKVEQAQRIAELESTLELIAAPIRPDGSWNRDRRACMDLAQAALRREGE